MIAIQIDSSNISIGNWDAHGYTEKSGQYIIRIFFHPFIIRQYGGSFILECITKKACVVLICFFLILNTFKYHCNALVPRTYTPSTVTISNIRIDRQPSVCQNAGAVASRLAFHVGRCSSTRGRPLSVRDRS
jgi:hypothetical protein